ncbi:carboxypeptidase A2-like [Centruroides vittatus]|uniref:carboxypeptidase A2-like n=1 Tax=Centruroides vittatus TaxID=120091 RepID=UPI00350F1298
MHNPLSDAYIGPSAMSEVETQAIVNTLSEVKHRVKLFITLHSYGQYIAFPWGSKLGHIDEFYTLKAIGTRAADVIKNYSGTEYRVGSIIQLMYPCTGNSVDWAYAELGVKHSFVIELRDKGREKFELDPRHIIPVGEETWNGIRSIIADIPQ